MTRWAPCTIVWARSAAVTLDLLAARDPRLAERLHTAIAQYALTGRGDVRALRGQPGYRLRVGDWRVVFDLDTARRESTCYSSHRGATPTVRKRRAHLGRGAMALARLKPGSFRHAPQLVQHLLHQLGAE